MKHSWRCASCNEQFAYNAGHIVGECQRIMRRDLIRAQIRIKVLEDENVRLKEELNRLAIVYGAGVGQIAG